LITVLSVLACITLLLLMLLILLMVDDRVHNQGDHLEKERVESHK